MGARSDSGSVTVVAAVLVPALLLVIALVVDGAGQLRTTSRADALAAEAARAAQTALDTRGQQVTVDADTAVVAARSYLRQAGHTGKVAVTGPDTVTVTVTITRPATLGLITSTHTATATATARLGVARPPSTGDER